MKAKVKKRVVSRKKQTKSTKSKSVNKSSNSKSIKSKKPVNNSSPTGKTAKTVKRGAKFIKGQSGNPKGRPKGSKNVWSLSEFQKEFEEDKKKHKGQSIYQFFFKRARKNDVVLVALLKKWQPDLKSVEQIAISADPVGDRKRSLSIQQKIAERMKMRNARPSQ